MDSNWSMGHCCGTGVEPSPVESIAAGIWVPTVEIGTLGNENGVEPSTVEIGTVEVMAVETCEGRKEGERKGED